MKLWLVKGLGSALKPADPSAVESLRKLALGEAVLCEVTRPRNSKFHRLVFALMQLVFENQDSYYSFDQFRRALTIEAGYFDDLRLLDGTTQREAKSLSFAKMDDLEFGAFYNALQDVILSKLLPGMSKPELDLEVQQFLGAWQ